LPTATIGARVERLSTASLRRVVEPEHDLPGQVGPGQVLPDELLSVHGLGLDLSSERRATLSREELAAVLDGGFRFEAVLMAAFCLELAVRDDLSDPRVAYALHEVGEETRHSRLFARVIEQLGPTATNPLRGGGRPGRWLERRGNLAIVRRPALINTLILAGEEIPDLIQKLASEHPATDPFVVAVNRYHRQEEARHLSFARLQVEERWAIASWADRFAVRRVAPRAIEEIFHSLVHPGVYGVVGLPPWRTWLRVRRLAERRQLLQRATRPVLAALVEGGVFKGGRPTRGWRRLCGVDRAGHPLPTAPAGAPGSG
jgi:hypothetical protein